MAAALMQTYLADSSVRSAVPPQVLFPQLREICERFVLQHVEVPKGAELVHVFQAPYYSWAIEILQREIHPDASRGESPELPRYDAMQPEGTTAEVDFWTSKDVRETTRSHVNGDTGLRYQLLPRRILRLAKVAQL